MKMLTQRQRNIRVSNALWKRRTKAGEPLMGYDLPKLEKSLDVFAQPLWRLTLACVCQALAENLTVREFYVYTRDMLQAARRYQNYLRLGQSLERLAKYRRDRGAFFR